jgi:hypothetical protein
MSWKEETNTLPASPDQFFHFLEKAMVPGAIFINYLQFLSALIYQNGQISVVHQAGFEVFAKLHDGRTCK